jgi:hypothetical protein
MAPIFLAALLLWHSEVLFVLPATNKLYHVSVLFVSQFLKLWLYQEFDMNAILKSSIPCIFIYETFLQLHQPNAYYV